MAGTAHLISRMPDMLSRHGKILLNELDGRRHDLLRRVVEIWRAKHPNLEIELHNGDALRLQMGGKPSLIIMNPPWGKYSRGKYGTALPGMVDIAERFTNWELEQHLADGGRLVAVMPTTILDGRWLKDIHQKYAIRAVARLPGWMYRARGTNELRKSAEEKQSRVLQHWAIIQSCMHDTCLSMLELFPNIPGL